MIRRLKKGDKVEKISLWVSIICWLIYMIWVIAKMFGVINTPNWLQNLPLLMAGIGLAGVFVYLGKYLERFDVLTKDFKELKKDVRQNTKEIHNLQIDMGIVKATIS